MEQGRLADCIAIFIARLEWPVVIEPYMCSNLVVEEFSVRFTAPHGWTPSNARRLRTIDNWYGYKDGAIQFVLHRPNVESTKWHMSAFLKE